MHVKWHSITYLFILSLHFVPGLQSAACILYWATRWSSKWNVFLRKKQWHCNWKTQLGSCNKHCNKQTGMFVCLYVCRYVHVCMYFIVDAVPGFRWYSSLYFATALFHMAKNDHTNQVKLVNDRYHHFRWYMTLENETPTETFPKFLSVLLVIDRSDQKSTNCSH